jgi:hypothetical protein
VVTSEELAVRTADFTEPVAFHRSSNYAHWNLTGKGAGRAIHLPQYGFLAECDEAQRIHITLVDPRAPRLPELVFHTARNIAWYLRGNVIGPAVHASAIELDGSALLFAGTKGAGKSTIFIDAVTQLGARPLSNDRVFVHNGTSAVSWPSYLSYCEGTIVDYPVLTAAFLAYEDDAAVDTRKRWGREFCRRYDQACKRIIQPSYLVAELGRRYRSHVQIAALVIPTVDPNSRRTKIMRTRSCAELTDREIEQFLFDAVDPDIANWHGMVGPSRAEQADLLRASVFPVHDLIYDPADGKADLRKVLASLSGNTAVMP